MTPWGVVNAPSVEGQGGRLEALGRVRQM